MTKNLKARLPSGKRARLCGLGLVLGVLAALGGWFCYNRFFAEHSLTTFAMGSYVQQTVWGGQNAAQAANEAITQLENRISWRVESSDIAKLNSQAGSASVELGETAGGVLAEALELSRLSGGALNIALGPVTRLWNFDNEPHVPEAGVLQEALALTSLDGISLTGGDGKLKGALEQAGMGVDLGAVGKGAACDAALAQYREAKASAAVVAVGGSVGLYGEKPGGGLWKVAVQDPEGAGAVGTLELAGGFVSTSGSYEKTFEEDGKTYHHLLDPRTGYPAESGLVSVTVWTEDSGLASDGLATACFVLGLDEGAALLAEYGGEGLFIDQKGQITLTPGLSDHFQPATGRKLTVCTQDRGVKVFEDS